MATAAAAPEVVVVDDDEDVEPAPAMPIIRKLRVCLLGGEALPKGVGKTDVAAALLRGITADWPSMLDPMYDFAYDGGAFEKAWAELLAEPPEDQPIGDRWGVGPLGAWSAQGHIFFSPKSTGSRMTPPYDADSNEESAALCSGNPEKFNLGHSRAQGICRTFREILTAASIDCNCLEEMHKELYEAAEQNPQVLVRKDKPAPGFLASFARFSPEVGDISGCGAVFLDIFEAKHRPNGREQNVAMAYAAAPNSRTHAGVTAATYLWALQFTAINLARLLREYNGDASGELPGEKDKAEWRKTDLRTRVEHYLSDRNLKADPALRNVVRDVGSWLDMEEIAAGVATQEELLEVLGSSKTVAVKVSENGKGFLRPSPSRVMPTPDTGVAAGVAKRKIEAMQAASMGMSGPHGMQAKRPPPTRMVMNSAGQMVPKGNGKGKEKGDSDDRMCWDWARGTCTKGANCKWVHMTLPNGLPPAGNREAQGPGGEAPGGPQAWISSSPGAGGPGLVSPSAMQGGGHGPAALFVGAWVQIQGLVAKTAFNGRIGMVHSYDEESSRWEVQLADGLTLKVKEENILVSPPGGASGGADGSNHNNSNGGAVDGPSRSGPVQFRPGARVRIHGLQGDVSYNGSLGSCTFFDEPTGRWDVQLDEGGSLRVREVNLFRCFS